MVLKYIKYIVFVVLVLCLVGPGSATDYFVKNGGSDSADGLSDTNAWENVSKVNGFSFSTGDDVYFKCDDTWTTQNLVVDWSGTSGNYVDIGAYYGNGIIGVSGDKPTFDGLNTTPAADYSGIILVYRRDYVNISNLSVINSRWDGVRVQGESSSVRKEYNNVKKVYTEGNYKVGVKYQYISKGIVEWCNVTDSARTEIGGGDWPAVIAITTSDNITVRKNAVYENYGEGIGLYVISHDCVVEDNIVFANKKVQIYVGHSYNNIVRRNLVYGTDNTTFWRTVDGPGEGIGISDESWMAAHSRNNTVYHNLIANTSIGLFLWTGWPAWPLNDTNIYNNIILDSRIANIDFSSGRATSENSAIKNNIVAYINGSGTLVTDAVSDAGLTWDYNLWSSTPDSDAQGSNDPSYAAPNITKTSGWTSLSGGDLNGSEFTLQADSTAIDEGTDLGSPYNMALASISTWPDDISLLDQDDYGTGWEIGAFVYGTAAGSAPNITLWQNDKTSNNTLDLTINVSEEVNFNATANQTITTWNWYKDDVDQPHNYNNISLNWSTPGLKHVIVNATNTNGTSPIITWNVTVENTVNTSYFTYHKIITINDTMVSSGIGTGIYPLLVSTTDTDLRDNAQADGDDIVFFASDNTTLLPYEQELWNSTTGELAEWVGVTDITNVSYIVLWYNNSTIANSENATGVWDSNFKLIQHLNETPAGTTYDSTSNNNDGTTVNMTSADQVSGQVDGSLDFDGDDHISLTSLAVENNSAFTISTWMNGTDGDIAYGEGYDGDAAWALFLGIDGSSPYSARFYIKENNVWKALSVGTTQINDSWHHVVLTQTNKSYRTILIDGVLENTTTSTYGNMSTLNTASIGVLERSTYGSYFVGGIDEQRISDIARSIPWSQTEYNNTASPELFISIGAEQGGAVEGYTPPNPTPLSNTTGNFWVNYTWSAGSGNVTDSYNVSYNSSWDNTSSNTYRNESVGAHGYLDIMVYAYNSSGAGTLSASSLTDNVTVPNNAISISNISASYTLNEGETLYIDADATDADSDTPTFDDNSTNWNVNSGTGIVSWVTANGDDGTYNWYINVSDGYGSIDTQAFSVTVNDSTYDPVVTLLSQTPSVIYQNSTGYMNISYGISHDSSGLNNTSVSFIYRNYDPLSGCSNHSIMVPDNDKAAEWSLDGRIIRAQNRNETLNFEENTSITGGDIYTWSGLDENTTRLSIVPVNSTYTLIYINATIHDIMPQMWYLDRTDMEEAPKTLMGIHKTQNLLIKLWNLELFKGNYDHITAGYTDTDLEDNPALWPLDADPLNYYYVNDSYDPATDGDPLTSGYAFYMGSGNASEWVDYVYSPHTNSSYVRSFINNSILNQYINTTEISYLYLTSNTPSSKPYYINVTNVASSTNVSFADTETLWAGDNTLSQQAYTPNTWLSFMKDGITFDHKLYVADNNDSWGNSTLSSTVVGAGLFPPTKPTFYAFHNGYTDYDMNNTYNGTFIIQIGKGSDPDGGDVIHNVTLHYGNETLIESIFNTTCNATCLYMNVSFDSTSYSTLENYTLKVVATDDEGETATAWLGVNFTIDYNNISFTNISVSPVNVLQGDTSTVSIDITDFDGTIDTAIVKIRNINYTMINTVGDTWSYTYSNSYVGKHYITNFYAQDNNLEWNSTTSTSYINVLDSSGGGGGAPGGAIPTATPTITPTVTPPEELKDDNITIPNIFKIIAGEGFSMLKINFGVDNPVYSKTIKYGDIESCTVLDSDFMACNASNGKVQVIAKPQLKGVYNYYTSYVQLIDNNETVHDIPVKIIVLDLMGWVKIPNIHVNSLPNILFEKEPITNDVIGMRLWWVFGLMGIGLYRYAKT